MRGAVDALRETRDHRNPALHQALGDIAANSSPRGVASRDPTTETPTSSGRSCPLTNRTGGI